MGKLINMRLLYICLLLLLPGCAIVPVIAAIPSAIVEPVFGQFGSQERSLAISMRTALVATQQSLLDMKLSVDVLEIDKDGYNIVFGNDTLSGGIELRRQTEKLTTIEVKVTTSTREESVETAVLDLIEGKAGRISKHQRFNFRGYHNLRKRPDLSAEKVGWYRPGALLAAKKYHRQPEWLKLKLPSGHYAFLKGSIQKHK